MAKVKGIKKRKLTPGGPKTRRALPVKAPVEASGTLPPAPADVVVDSAPVLTTGGSPTGALPRSRKKPPAHIQAALDRALATSEGKEAPPADTTGVDPALVREFSEGGEAPTARPGPTTSSEPVGVVTRYPLGPGRPSPYRPEFCEAAKQYYESGATDYDVAELFNVSVWSLRRWRAEHIEFRTASAIGKANADNEVERSLFQNATGYTRRTEKVMSFQGTPFVVEHLEHVPGDVGAQKHWLANRKRDEWSSDPDVKPSDPLAAVGAMTMIELARRMGTLLVSGMKAEARVVEHDDSPTT